MLDNSTKRVKITIILLFTVMLTSIFTVVVPAIAGKHNILRVPQEYASIQEAIDAANDGDVILVGPGEWTGAFVTKAVKIIGTQGLSVIVDGPAHFLAPQFHCGFALLGPGTPPDGWPYDGSGATISHFVYKGGVIEGTSEFLAFPIYAYDVDDVLIEHNIIYNARQGITNWEGNDWIIRHNVIEGLWAPPGSWGLGITLGSGRADFGVSGNRITNNQVFAELPIDCDHFACGILLESIDAPWSLGSGTLTNNRVVLNKIKVSGPLPSFAIFLSDQLASSDNVYDNIVSFNDLRGSSIEVYAFPPTLKDVNRISQNLGDNRGQDEVPANVF